jgi:hypothetical protein
LAGLIGWRVQEISSTLKCFAWQGGLVGLVGRAGWMDQYEKLVDSIAPAVECPKLGSVGWLVELCGWAGWLLVAGMFAHPLARMMQNTQMCYYSNFTRN